MRLEPAILPEFVWFVYLYSLFTAGIKSGRPVVLPLYYWTSLNEAVYQYSLPIHSSITHNLLSFLKRQGSEHCHEIYWEVTLSQPRTKLTFPTWPWLFTVKAKQQTNGKKLKRLPGLLVDMLWRSDHWRRERRVLFQTWKAYFLNAEMWHEKTCLSDNLRDNSASVLATQKVQHLYLLNFDTVWLYSPVCLRSGRKSRRQVFSRRDSLHSRQNRVGQSEWCPERCILVSRHEEFRPKRKRRTKAQVS